MVRLILCGTWPYGTGPWGVIPREGAPHVNYPRIAAGGDGMADWGVICKVGWGVSNLRDKPMVTHLGLDLLVP